MAIPYRPFERRTLENLLAGSQAGLSPEIGYSIFSDIQGGALDRLAGKRDLRMQRRLRRQDQNQAFASQLPGLAEFATNMSLADVPSGVVSSAFSGFAPRFQGGLDELVGAAYPGNGSLADVAGTETPFFDAEDQAMVRKAVEDAWAMGLRDEEQLIEYIIGTLGEAGAAAMPFIEPIVRNTVGRLRMTDSSTGTGTPSETVRKYGLGGGPLGGFLDSLR